MDEGGVEAYTHLAAKTRPGIIEAIVGGELQPGAPLGAL